MLISLSLSSNKTWTFEASEEEWLEAFFVSSNNVLIRVLTFALVVCFNYCLPVVHSVLLVSCIGSYLLGCCYYNTFRVEMESF